MAKEELKVGVIRDSSLYRANSAGRERADAEYRAVRPSAMATGKYTCAFCGWVSRKNNECHHRDGNHANNSPENFAVADTLCHGYHHLGQRASQDRFAPDNLGDKTVLAAIPEISAADLNLLQRALGVALLDGDKDTAREIMKVLAERAQAVKASLGTYRPGDIAAAMVRLSDVEYESRDHVCAPLRLLFNQDTLEAEGKKFKEDFPGLPFDSWTSVFK